MNNFYFDVHGHIEGLMPAAMRLVPGNTVPPDFKLKDCMEAGVSGFVLCVLGDPNTFFPVKVDPFKHVLSELSNAKNRVAAADAEIVYDAAGLESASARGKPAFLLGIEGGDFIGEDLDRLDSAFEAGARLIGPVHYSANSIGSIAFGWAGRIVSEAEQTGLSEFGKAAIARANKLGMIVDLAHADEKTAWAALSASSTAPICSHTGPLALQPFPRYISDNLMKAIGEAGGIIGLWAFYFNAQGAPDLETFGIYAAHCAEVAGVEHLAIGTDINGVPGNMAGYLNPFDAPRILETLAARGFSEEEIRGIAGENFLKFFRAMAG